MRILLLLGITMLTSGCLYQTYDYYYISLKDSENIKLVSKQKIKISELHDNSEIPVEYLANREQYSLRFKIGDITFSPHLMISIEGPKGVKLSFNPRRDTSIKGKNGVVCQQFYPDKNNTDRINFVWSNSCIDSNLVKVISFDVIDKKNNIISHEDIPFTLIKDGKITLIDGL